MKFSISSFSTILVILYVLFLPELAIAQSSDLEDGVYIPRPACMLSDSALEAIINYPPSTGPIVAFGDSLTAGVGATLGQDYVSELEDLIDEDIINAGVSGDTTAEALDRLEDDVLSQNPRAVIVWLGGNDILGRYYEAVEEQAGDDSFWEILLEAILDIFDKVPDDEEVLTEDETFANIETIVERIQDTGAVVILVGLDGEPLDNGLNGRYQAVAQETGAIFVSDVLDGIIGRPSLTSSDLIHPNNAGYEIVAGRIYTAVACVVPDDGDDPDDDPDDDDPTDDDTDTGGSGYTCVDSDNDGYRECTFNGGVNSDDDDDEPEDDPTDDDDTGSGNGAYTCVDSDNDGYQECSVNNSGNNDDDSDDDPTDDDTDTGSSGFSCVDSDNDGYRECTYSGGSTDDDTDDEPEDDPADDDDADSSNGAYTCVDSDNDGYQECSVNNSGSNNDDTNDEPEDDNDTDTGSSGFSCVDSDNDGYQECSYGG